MLSRVGKALRIISDEEEQKIAIVIDASTLLPDFNLSFLGKINKALKEIGTIRFGKVITERQITERESVVIKNHGFQEEILSGDVDIHVTINALELSNSKTIDIVAIGTTDQVLFPVLSRIKLLKKLALISWKEAITPAMESVADWIIYLDFNENKESKK